MCHQLSPLRRHPSASAAGPGSENLRNDNGGAHHFAARLPTHLHRTCSRRPHASSPSPARSLLSFSTSPTHPQHAVPPLTTFRLLEASYRHLVASVRLCRLTATHPHRYSCGTGVLIRRCEEGDYRMPMPSMPGSTPASLPPLTFQPSSSPSSSPPAVSRHFAWVRCLSHPKHQHDAQWPTWPAWLTACYQLTPYLQRFGVNSVLLDLGPCTDAEAVAVMQSLIARLAHQQITLRVAIAPSSILALLALFRLLHTPVSSQLPLTLTHP